MVRRDRFDFSRPISSAVRYGLANARRIPASIRNSGDVDAALRWMTRNQQAADFVGRAVHATGVDNLAAATVGVMAADAAASALGGSPRAESIIMESPPAVKKRRNITPSLMERRFGPDYMKKAPKPKIKKCKVVGGTSVNAMGNAFGPAGSFVIRQSIRPRKRPPMELDSFVGFNRHKAILGGKGLMTKGRPPKGLTTYTNKYEWLGKINREKFRRRKRFI